MKSDSNLIYFCDKFFNMKNYLFIAAFTVLTACGSTDKPAEEAKKDEPLEQTSNSTAFNQSFSRFLNSYYSLKDALVANDSTLASTAANTLANAADSLSLNELKADSSIILTAKDYVSSISSDAKVLASEANLKAKRKSFQTISDNIYTLLQTVRYDQEVVYHQFCPMAFDDAGAAWLSKTSDIKNPYFGKKMLTCGEVKDSIDFRGK